MLKSATAPRLNNMMVLAQLTLPQEGVNELHETCSEHWSTFDSQEGEDQNKILENCIQRHIELANKRPGTAFARNEQITMLNTHMKNLILISIFTFFTTFLGAQTLSSKQTESSKPFVLGEIRELQSKQLNEQRTLNIYLPEGYNPNDTIRYPVIYLLDGSADEDFIHIAGLVQFNSFEWVNQVPKSIVVGIATVDRKRDFTFPTSIEEDRKKYPTTGHSDHFMAFIETELQPFIQKTYKTNAAKTLIGQSLGGLLATEILFRKPTLFSTYIIVSPSLWWDNGSLLNQDSPVLNDNFTQPTAVYIGVGKEGLTPTAMPRVMEVDANLLAEKINETKSKTVKIHFDYLPLENHASIMHQAVSNAFRLLYPPAKE